MDWFTIIVIAEATENRDLNVDPATAAMVFHCLVIGIIFFCFCAITRNRN